MPVAEILARGWTFKLGGVTIAGIDSFGIGSSDNKADTTTFEDEGRLSHLVASRGNTLKLTGKHQEDPDTGDRDAGQAAVETLADAIGNDSLGEWTITSPGGNTWTFDGSATMDEVGGGNDDPTKWGCTVQVSGAITKA